MTLEAGRGEVVARFYQALNRSEIASARGLLSAGCIRHAVRGVSPASGDHVGRDAVIASMERMIELSDDLSFECTSVMTNENVVASSHVVRGRRAARGNPLEVEMLVRWRVRNGRIEEFWEFALDVPQLDGFFN